MGERREVGGQVLGGRHHAALDQHGNDADVLVLQRGCHLDPEEVFGIVEAALVLSRIPDGQPLPADDGEQHGAGLELAPDELDEIHSRGDVVGVLEDAVGAEMRLEGGQQRQHMPRAVLAAVADEDARLGLRTCGHLSLDLPAVRCPVRSAMRVAPYGAGAAAMRVAPYGDCRHKAPRRIPPASAPPGSGGRPVSGLTR
jgi:hypothetical protein